jgi:hypothetical protein
MKFNQCKKPLFNSNLPKVKAVFGLLILFPFAACSKPSASTDVKLFNGSLVPENNLTSSVQLGDFCGAVRISEKSYLTAAHCVVNRQNFGGISTPEDGAKITLRVGNNENKTSLEVTVQKVDVFPLYLEVLEKENIILSPHSSQPADIAVLSLKEAVPNVSISAVDFSEAKPGQEIVLNGFGSNRLTKVTPSSESVHKFLDSRVDSLAENYIVSTPFTFGGLNSGSTAKGDSGSPVYLKNGNMKNPPVIGVNSFVQTIVDGTNVVIKSFFTRLDKNAAGNPEQWLRTAVPDLTDAASQSGNSNSGLDFSRSLILDCDEDVSSGLSLRLELLDGRNSSQGFFTLIDGDKRSGRVQTQVEHNKLNQGSSTKDEYRAVMKDLKLEISASLDQESPTAQALLTFLNGEGQGELIERKVSMTCRTSILE